MKKIFAASILAAPCALLPLPSPAMIREREGGRGNIQLTITDRFGYLEDKTHSNISPLSDTI